MDVGRIQNNLQTSNVATSRIVKGEDNAKIDTTDKLTRAESPGFLGKINSFITNNITGTKDAAKAGEDFGKKDFCSVKNGALAGAMIGGTAGAVIGYVTTETDPSKLPQQTVELKWSEPVLQRQYLGEIPNDSYTLVENDYKSAGKAFEGAMKQLASDMRTSVDPTKSVYADAPVEISGGEGTLMTQRQATFTGRGEMNIKWETKPINQPYLAGYKDNQVMDTHKAVIGKTPDGKPVTAEVVDGVQHKFVPEIKYQQIGSYKTPHVEFKDPDPWEHAGIGLAIGVMAGASIGVVIGAIHKVISKG